MVHPHMPNIPGAGVMNDTLDFVKNLWGSMSVPGLTAPTLSVEELDKKINDLKAVESWLNLNMSMLRGSIQALEVQRGTIATLKSVGASLASAVNTGVNDKSIFDANPYASAFFHHAREADKAQTAAPSPAPAPEPQPAPEAKAAEQPKPAAGAASAQPNAWWNLLQEQFKQAVSTAMASESMMTDAAVKFAAAAAGANAKPADKKPAQDAPAGAPSTSASAAANPAAVKKPAAKKPAAKKAAAKPPARPGGGDAS
ncbi:DNA polymerase III gamma/tau subunit [Duganella sp. 1224]|uniref:PhaM family polyhydroxyalkanoate granule multifunctional regulatory protein n=1 Tax=Duganella sp. 1224 TaxID=2587052 RepID=UPI0015C6EA33|nr:PhaM family polyhydroxyalkanoate granule multifunctional regulatory protein [Duganella sp. 1224]NYE63436.1 DNA polymerase III gamma/tau subunit [Duganella sp. 1224]